jgi:ATP-binding cassette, subfamily C (CFTR/MRP), member 2
MAVKVEAGVFAWDKETEMETTVLKGVNVEVRKGELAAVVGMVGAGKSSLCCPASWERCTRSPAR